MRWVAQLYWRVELGLICFRCRGGDGSREAGGRSSAQGDGHPAGRSVPSLLLAVLCCWSVLCCPARAGGRGGGACCASCGVSQRRRSVDHLWSSPGGSGPRPGIRTWDPPSSPPPAWDHTRLQARAQRMRRAGGQGRQAGGRAGGRVRRRPALCSQVWQPHPSPPGPGVSCILSYHRLLFLDHANDMLPAARACAGGWAGGRMGRTPRCYAPRGRGRGTADHDGQTQSA